MPDTPATPNSPAEAGLDAIVQAPEAAVPAQDSARAELAEAPTAATPPDLSPAPTAAPSGEHSTEDSPDAEASTALSDTAEPAEAAPAQAEPGQTDAARNTPRRPRDMSPAACAELLKQHFPALFSGQPKPLKLRIQADIAQRAPGVFGKPALSAFFRRHTGSTAYLIALGKATQRFDLDGEPAGELTEEHRQLAREELTRRRQVTREREQQSRSQSLGQAPMPRATDQASDPVQQAEFRAAQAELRAQQAELRAQQAELRIQQMALQAQQAGNQQERQARLALLRDYDRTTLTMANFCALRGIKPEALTPLLEQARREAAEAPPPLMLDDRRGPMRRDGFPGGDRDLRQRHEGRDSGDGRFQARPAGGQHFRSDPRSAPHSETRPDPRTDRRGFDGPRHAPNPAPAGAPQPHDRPGDRPRPAQRPDNRPDARTAARPHDGQRPDGRPRNRPDNRADHRPEARPGPPAPGGSDKLPSTAHQPNDQPKDRPNDQPKDHQPSIASEVRPADQADKS